MAKTDPLFKDALSIASILREKALAEQCETSFREFVRQSWPILSPGVPYIHNWHIDCLCEHVEALARREILRLIINICPRSAKSTILSVQAAAWRWIKCPEEKFVSSSYGRSLAMRDSRRTRSLIKSPWYQARWGPNFTIVKDQDEKGRFENDKGGYRLANSVEGGVLGEGGSWIIMDDPNDLDKMEFQDYRQSVKDWYSNSLASRYINPKTDVRLCVQQRSSYGDDLTSYLLELGGWEHLVIPNEYDGSSKTTSIGWRDPRTHIGELMHPERLGPAEVGTLKIEMRDNYEGQYNQKPASISGGRLKREWLNFWNPPGTERVDESGKIIPVRLKRGAETIEKIPRALPEAFEQVVQSWDMAFKDEAVNSQVAGHAWGRIGANCYLIERDTQHRNFPATLAAFRAMSARIPCPEKLVEEKANGPAVIQTLRDEIPGIVPVNPEGGKFARVAAISGYVEAGNVWLPNPEIFPWVWDFLTELEGSPQDDTDAMTQALTRLFASMANQGVPEFRVQPRVGEPQTACHITRSAEGVPAEWRRFVAILPNEGALWLSETPTGSLRVLRELSLKGVDSAEAGRLIAKTSLPDVLARANGIHAVKQSYELLLPKAAFAPIEPIGSYAELLEQGLLSFIPEDGDFEYREHARTAIKEARFRTDMVEEEDAALDRLRSLLAFAPPDFQKVPYDRKKAFALAEADPYKYAEYIMAVEGEVRGEWPKLKISPKCPELISQLGAFRRDRLEEAPAMVRALLLGVCVPRRFEIKEIKERPAVARPGRGSLVSKKFALGRR